MFICIGSVPPHNLTNCVKDVVFENIGMPSFINNKMIYFYRHIYKIVKYLFFIEFQDPFKAIYVKTNPGWSGDGLISNILYKNITAYNSIWY